MGWVHQETTTHKGSGREEVFQRPEFVDGEGFYYLGKHYRLKLDVPPDAPQLPRQSILLATDCLLRREQWDLERRRIAEIVYTRTAHPYLNSSAKRWKSIVGVEPAPYVEVLDLVADGARAAPTEP